MKLLVICNKRYNGTELWTSLGMFRQAGIEFEVVSQDTIIRDEATLKPNKIARKVYDVSVQDLQEFDGLAIPSGHLEDTEAYWDDAHVQSLVKAARQRAFVIAAICCAVPSLAGIVSGVKVSFFPILRAKRRLTEAGALLQDVCLTVDRKVITAEYPAASSMWAEEIVNALHNKPPIYNLVASGYKPKGSPRRMLSNVQQSIDEAKAFKK